MNFSRFLQMKMRIARLLPVVALAILALAGMPRHGAGVLAAVAGVDDHGLESLGARAVAPFVARQPAGGAARGSCAG